MKLQNLLQFYESEPSDKIVSLRQFYSLSGAQGSE